MSSLRFLNSENKIVQVSLMGENEILKCRWMLLKFFRALANNLKKIHISTNAYFYS